MLQTHQKGGKFWTQVIWSDEAKALIQVFGHKFDHKQIFQLDNHGKNTSKTDTTKPAFWSGYHKGLISVP